MARQINEQDTQKKASIIGKKRYTGTEKIESHLFTLEIEDMKKNTSLDKKFPKYDLIPHSHRFHTYDSSGRKQSRSCYVGGHYHEIKCEFGEKGDVTKIEILPAKYDNESNQFDRHVHKATYIRTSVVEPRVLNPEAIREYMNMANEGDNQ